MFPNNQQILHLNLLLTVGSINPRGSIIFYWDFSRIFRTVFAIHQSPQLLAHPYDPASQAAGLDAALEELIVAQDAVGPGRTHTVHPLFFCFNWFQRQIFRTLDYSSFFD